MNKVSSKKNYSIVFTNIVFIGRPLKIILDLMNISCISDLKGLKILDCPGGPGTVSLELKQHGIDTIAVDPLYSKSKQELEIELKNSIEKTYKMYKEDKQKRDVFVSDFDIEALHEVRKKTGNLFLDDFVQGKKEGRYIAASLPHLPFQDNYFDITWSVHLLFAYANLESGGLDGTGKLFPYEFHYQAIKELLRVTKKEVLIAPASKFFLSENIPNDFAKQLSIELQLEGYIVSFLPVHYHMPYVYNNTTLLMKIIKK